MGNRVNNLLIVSYYRQLSADIKMKIIRLKPDLLKSLGFYDFCNNHENFM